METSKKKQKPSKEQLEERAQAKAHRQLLKKLREQDACPEYDDDPYNPRYDTLPGVGDETN